MAGTHITISVIGIKKKCKIEYLLFITYKTIYNGIINMNCNLKPKAIPKKKMKAYIFFIKYNNDKITKL